MDNVAMIDRAQFFAAVRKPVFGGRITQSQVSGVERLLDEAERRNFKDLRQLAYILATSFWETGKKMQPVREIGKGKGRKYGAADPVTGHVYYGRGDVQLTWKDNYAKMGKLIGVDLVGNPDLALKPDVSAKVLFEGMIRGSFTGKKLSDYFSATKADWNNARRIVNGTDKAATIAAIAQAFYAGLSAAEVAGKAVTRKTAAQAPTVTTTPAAEATPAKPGLWSTLWSTLRGRDPQVANAAPEKARPGLKPSGSPVLYDQQEMLSAKGYTEVGEPDGLLGGKTASAVRAFRKENGLPPGDEIDEKFSAALVAAGPRKIATYRAEATAKDLREKGNTQVGTLDDIGWLGKMLGLGGLVGGVQQSGVLDTATSTLQSVNETFSTIASILVAIISAVQWCVSHWWMFALAAGVYIAWKVAMGILNAVVLFRQGFLARADK